METKNIIQIKALCIIATVALSILPGSVFGQTIINHRENNGATTSTQEMQISISNQDVLTILETKCNACHKRKNPFMIFNERNMNKRAMRIERQVFQLKRMPKEGGLPLTTYDYEILKNWIESIK